MPVRKKNKTISTLKRVSYLALFFCLALYSAAFAMDIRPNITLKGRVTETATNRIISGANVTVSSLIKKLTVSVSTDKTGNYTVSKAPSGICLIKCSAKGCNPVSLTRNLKSGRTPIILNFKLKPLKKNNPPKITVLTPKDKFSLIAGDTLYISANARDQDKDKLQYRFLLDSKVIRGWSSASSCKLKTSSSKIGRHKIKAEVRDNKGGIDRKSADIFIFIAFPKPAG